MNRNRKTKPILTCLLMVAGAILPTGGAANAEFKFGTPANLGTAINSIHDEAAPCISTDGLELYFCDTPLDLYPGGQGGQDIWVAKRVSTDQPWSTAVNLGSPVNGASDDGVPRLSSDGLSLYFASNRRGGYGNFDIWVSTRTSPSSPWGAPANIGSPVNTSADEAFFSISVAGLELYFSEWQSIRPAGFGQTDIWVARRPSPGAPWGTPVNLGAEVNSGHKDEQPFISPDGLSLFFLSDRPGGYTTREGDIWVTTRRTVSESWSTPVNLGPIVNNPDSGGSTFPYISADDSVLYFTAYDRPGGYGGYDLWEVPIIYVPQCGDAKHPYPMGDLNQDCRVDYADLALLCECWLQDNNP
ncbi:MAG: PD40 domain-containing protein [Phycisphaerales bacterium]|nr:MAG: PD40 domain-containing protein [Phycisphaerales bacterium]